MDFEKLVRELLGHKTEEEIRKAVDDRSERLFAELSDHWKGVKDTVPDQRTAYEGWAIQKIAGLQLAVMDLTQDVEKLRRYVDALKKR